MTSGTPLCWKKQVRYAVLGLQLGGRVTQLAVAICLAYSWGGACYAASWTYELFMIIVVFCRVVLEALGASLGV